MGSRHSWLRDRELPTTGRALGISLEWKGGGEFGAGGTWASPFHPSKLSAHPEL